jgi:hypothetical protein
MASWTPRIGSDFYQSDQTLMPTGHRQTASAIRLANGYLIETIGGAEGNRTPDLLNAIQALSQLSYGPDR